jgi:hypothetical protein
MSPRSGFQKWLNEHPESKPPRDNFWVVVAALLIGLACLCIARLLYLTATNP